MILKRKTAIGLIICLVVLGLFANLSFVSAASIQEMVFDSVTSTPSTAYYISGRSANTNARTTYLMYVTFTGSGIALSKASFYIALVGGPISPTADHVLVARVFNVQNTDLINGTHLAQSSSVSVTIISSTPGWVSFEFDQTFTPTAGQKYIVGLECLGNNGLSGLDGFSPRIAVYAGADSTGHLAVQQYTFYNWDDTDAWFDTSISRLPANNAFLFKCEGILMSYGVIYDANWPTSPSGSGTVPIDNNWYLFEAMVPVLGGTGTLSLFGYNFLGWSFSNTATMPDFAVTTLGVIPATFIMPKNDVTLYAVWQLATAPPTDPPTATPPPTPPPIIVPQDTTKISLKFSATEQHIFDASGYLLDTTSGVVTSSFGDNLTSNMLGIGFRVWLIGEGSKVELSSLSPIAVAFFTENTNEYVSVDWACPGSPVILGKQALKIVMYTTVDNGATWIPNIDWYSEVLLTTKIVESAWTFTYHIEYAVATSYLVSWSGVHNSAGVANILFANSSIYDVMVFKLFTLDLAGFILYPYLAILGEIFYVTVILGIFGAYYIYHGKVTVVLFMLIFFGSAGGIVFVFLPTPANIVVWIMLAVGFAVLLFRVFR